MRSQAVLGKKTANEMDDNKQKQNPLIRPNYYLLLGPKFMRRLV